MQATNSQNLSAATEPKQSDQPAGSSPAQEAQSGSPATAMPNMEALSLAPQPISAQSPAQVASTTMPAIVEEARGASNLTSPLVRQEQLN